MVNSRNGSFVGEIFKVTHWKGIDAVINSLTGDLLYASWRSCAKFERFVEVGKRDPNDVGKLNMSMFLRV